MDNFGAFAITYNRPRILLNTLEEIFKQTVTPERVLIIDNGASEATRTAVEGMGRKEIRYVAMQENLGPAGAAAYGLKLLGREGYKYILWIDDDDPPSSPDVVERLLKIFSSSQGPVGAVGCMGAKFDWHTGKFVRFTDEELRGVLEVDCIPGGGLPIINSEAIATAGVPDEKMFFGFEELDYCLRLQRHGFRLLIDGDMFLKRRLSWRRIKQGWPSGRVRLREKNQIWRSYYSTRNYIWIMNKKSARPDLAIREVGRAFIRAAVGYRKGWRYGWEHFRMQGGGVIDGYRGRLGRRFLPDQSR